MNKMVKSFAEEPNLGYLVFFQTNRRLIKAFLIIYLFKKLFSLRYPEIKSDQPHRDLRQI